MLSTKIFFAKIILICCIISSFSTSRVLQLQQSKQLPSWDSEQLIIKQKDSIDEPTPELQCDVENFSKHLVNKDRYTVESHEVITDDGYILQMFRVRLRADLLQKLPENLKANANQPFLMQHGLFSDSTTFVKSETSFVYYLLEKGQDCWLGNNRGSKYSLNHIDKDITQKDYYQYSFTEMGLFDLQSFYKQILKIYKNNDEKQIFYFGHSEGTSQMFVALTDERTKKFTRKHTAAFVAISPVAYLTQVNFKSLKMLSHLNEFFQDKLMKVGLYTIANINCSFSLPYWNQITDKMCKKFKKFCNASDVTVDESSIAHSGASILQISHYGQLTRGDEDGNPIFRPFNYGTEKNMKIYGQELPPEWSFDDWNTELHMIVGSNDPLATTDNVDVIVSKQPEDFYFTEKVMDGYGHSTALGPDDANDILKIIKNLLNL